jgi:putative protease
LGRLGQTPFELGNVLLSGANAGDPPDGVMAPKSVLNDLRRQAVEVLLSQRSTRRIHQVVDGDALDHLRHEAASSHSDAAEDGSRLSVLARNLEQLRAVLDWASPTGQRPEMVYCDFEDVRRYKEAVEMARAAGIPIALATLRIVKPGEEGLLRQIADCAPDAVLVRNLAAVSFYSELSPRLPMIGDYALNIANDLTAAIFADAGLIRMVLSYDLNWKQLAAVLQRFPPARFEMVLHQHMPMFHMEHCVFAHTLSTGKDYRDCGRPCERHRVDLRDRVGQAHPLIPDVGCRNTLFNATAQSAAEYVPEMKRLGLRHFRVELLREQNDDVVRLLDRYASILAGLDDPKSAWRQLRVLNQLGVTRGTLDHL